ncbi:MAG: alpha-galactosidase [Clostridia bacterium]|nr:alpha-galactosidase [Clostridia bacterium]
MIKFDKNNKVFTLDTVKTTYAIGLMDEGVLVHLYWGKKLKNPINAEWKKDFIWRSHSPFDYGDYSTNVLPLEFSAYGGGDSRLPSFSALYDDGSRVSKYRFKGYEIVNGKPEISGLPSTYAEKGDRVQTLIINLFDELKNVDIYLNYSVFEDLDAITRNVKIVNGGNTFKLHTVLSATTDFFGTDDMDIIHLDGAWARERYVTRQRIVKGNQNIKSQIGVSSSYHNPFIAVCDKNTTENSGDAYGFNLVYSGNFTAGAELNPYGTLRAYIGINPNEFEWVLESGKSFETPEAILVYSPEGLSGMSRIFHRLIRTRLARGKWRDKERYALINNWEATYFDFNEDKIVEIAKKAKEIGVDTMVLDDGWFGRRTGETRGLGDWVEMPERLPNGLKGLADRVNALGMRFGLWFEPEMVNPDSELFETHPDWIIHTKGRTPSKIRDQYTLDLSRDEVCEYIVNAVGSVLEKANIEYVKWDMNRQMSEVGSAGLPSENQGEVMHRYMLGLYRVLDTLTKKFPNVLFEACASGGARYDGGILHYMPQVWASDDTDAVERILIQYGTSFVYPYSSMGAHVSACPNHQNKRTTPFEMRCQVAIAGQFGFELDLNKCSGEELEIAKKAVEDYRRLGEIFHKGDLYRLRSPFETQMAVNEFISEDKKKVLVCIYPHSMTTAGHDEYIKLAGLEENANYELNGKIYGGDYLMNKGIYFINDSLYKTRILELNKC